jgi:DNA-binding response OmpR family regulator
MTHPNAQAVDRKKGILLVDDEERDLETVATVLEDAGFTVFKAESSTQAAEVAQEHFDSIDFLVTDIALPGLNGVELHRNLCDMHTKLCNVLFISARSGSEILRFYGLAISDPHFLAKPFSAKQLLSRVNTLIESRLPLQIKAS